MGPLRYSINITVDGCCDHRAVPADAALHEHHAANLAGAEALLLGRTTFELMEDGWRGRGDSDLLAEDPFAAAINSARKYVVSRTLRSVGWNAELITGDLATGVMKLKQRHGGGILTGGVQLPRELARLALIDEYEFVVHPRIAGRGPWIFEGLPRHLDLELVGRGELSSGAVVLRYVPRTR